MGQKSMSNNATAAQSAIGESKAYAAVRFLPYCISLLFLPIAALAILKGSWWIGILYITSIIIPPVMDLFLRLNFANPDPSTRESELFWHRLLILAWPFIQFLVIFGAIAVVTLVRDVSTIEALILFGVIGAGLSTFGEVFAHELIHRNTKGERFLGEFLYSLVLYAHYRTEHLLVHHRFVSTPRDPVTAQYGENLYWFLFRVLSTSLYSAWFVELVRLKRREKSVLHHTNPFWRYFGLQTMWIGLAGFIGGWFGVLLFSLQAIIAIVQLEIINFVEHYGLQRQRRGSGEFEPVEVHHSWNSAHTFSNYMLINLPRHSDHHFKPDRPYPLMRAVDETQAPQLPYAYPVMFLIAAFPSWWRSVMDPLVEQWRATYYPNQTDWTQEKRPWFPDIQAWHSA